MDWLRFLSDHNIEHATAGLNIKRGNVGCKCPFCGDEDPSMHMGISLTKDAYSCWRSPDHAGRKPHRLVQALLGCSYAHAALAVAQYSRSDPSDLEGALMAMNATSEPDSPEKQDEVFTHLPDGFTEIRLNLPGFMQKYPLYLKARGFNPEKVSRRYSLGCYTTGRWKDRIIIPVRHGPHDLVGWTARSVTDECDSPRYLESSSALKSTVFPYKTLRDGGRTLFVVEGPFDAMKIDFYGKEFGVRAVCTFGVRLSIGQAMLLNSVASRFRRIYVLYDRNASAMAYQSAQWLTGKNVRVAHFNYEELKDPGAMNADQAVRFASRTRFGAWLDVSPIKVV